MFNENVEKYPTNTEEENLKLAETAMAEQVFKEIKDFSAKGWKSFFELSANKEEGFSPKDWFCSYFLTPIKGFLKMNAIIIQMNWICIIMIF